MNPTSEITEQMEGYQETPELLTPAIEADSKEVEAVASLLHERWLLDLCEKQQNLQPPQLGFNLFRLISETYHRENLHSDVLAALLNPNECHGGGHTFLHLFIDWLAEISEKKLEGLNARNFKNSEVRRESGRIDIGILDNDSKMAIIVENKINGFRDMDRQLPRYLEHLEEGEVKFKVVAIVYLNLREKRSPSNYGYKDGDSDKIDPIIIPLAAFHQVDSCLCKGFLRRCEEQTTNIDTLLFLRQYRQLITTLAFNTMDYDLMNQFHAELITGNGKPFHTALALGNLMRELPDFRTELILREFEGKYEPFAKAEKDGSEPIAYFHNERSGLVVGVTSHERTYEVFLKESGYPIDSSLVGRIVAQSSLKFSPKETEWGEMYTRCYDFPERETALFKDLKTLFEEISNSG